MRIEKLREAKAGAWKRLPVAGSCAMIFFGGFFLVPRRTFSAIPPAPFPDAFPPSPPHWGAGPRPPFNIRHRCPELPPSLSCTCHQCAQRRLQSGNVSRAMVLCSARRSQASGRARHARDCSRRCQDEWFRDASAKTMGAAAVVAGCVRAQPVESECTAILSELCCQLFCRNFPRICECSAWNQQV